MNDPYALHEQLPTLDAPVLVVMLTGWIDASGAAAAAMATVEEECVGAAARHVRRRHVHRLPRPAPDDGAARRRQHPSGRGPTSSCSVGRDADGHDVLMLTGPEPDSQWRAFADVRRRRSRSTSACTQMVALGAYPFATPHTRDAAPVEQLAVDRGRRQRCRT